MELEGVLFNYGPYNRLCAFRSGYLHWKDVNAIVLFVAGLTDGMLSKPYLVTLSHQLNAPVVSGSAGVHGGIAQDILDSTKKTMLIQVTLGSSYMGFGGSSLCHDVHEMDLLLDEVMRKVRESRGIEGESLEEALQLPKLVILGHSTGCQDALHYAKFGKYGLLQQKSRILSGIILQGPVSDREYGSGTYSPSENAWEEVKRTMFPIFIPIERNSTGDVGDDTRMGAGTSPATGMSNSVGMNIFPKSWSICVYKVLQSWCTHQGIDLSHLHSVIKRLYSQDTRQSTSNDGDFTSDRVVAKSKEVGNVPVFTDEYILTEDMSGEDVFVNYPLNSLWKQNLTAIYAITRILEYNTQLLQALTETVALDLSHSGIQGTLCFNENSGRRVSCQWNGLDVLEKMGIPLPRLPVFGGCVCAHGYISYVYYACCYLIGETPQRPCLSIFAEPGKIEEVFPEGLTKKVLSLLQPSHASLLTCLAGNSPSLIRNLCVILSPCYNSGILPSGIDMCPISCSRWLSLNARYGTDDMFSSDVYDIDILDIPMYSPRFPNVGNPDSENSSSENSRFAWSSVMDIHPPVSTLWLLSGKDEYFYSQHTFSCHAHRLAKVLSLSSTNSTGVATWTDIGTGIGTGTGTGADDGSEIGVGTKTCVCDCASTTGYSNKHWNVKEHMLRYKQPLGDRPQQQQQQHQQTQASIVEGHSAREGRGDSEHRGEGRKNGEDEEDVDMQWQTGVVAIAQSSYHYSASTSIATGMSRSDHSTGTATGADTGNGDVGSCINGKGLLVRVSVIADADHAINPVAITHTDTSSTTTTACAEICHFINKCTSLYTKDIHALRR